jgi:predicted ATPase
MLQHAWRRREGLHAAAVARHLAPEFGEGSFFVPLASISDPDLIPSAIASSVGIRERAEQTLTETLIDELSHCEALIVLDNGDKTPTE